MNNIITNQSKEFQALVDDCRAIITEAVFTSRWALIEGYHALGKRIVKDNYFKTYERGNMKKLSVLSTFSGIHERDLYRAIQFYEKYPDLRDVPQGKNISWNKIITKYLPDRPHETPQEILQLRSVYPQYLWSASAMLLRMNGNREQAEYHLKEFQRLVESEEG
jgi:hypothetical protein